MYRRKKQLRQALDTLDKAMAVVKDQALQLDNSVEQNKQAMAALNRAIASSDYWQRLYQESTQAQRVLAVDPPINLDPRHCRWVN